MHSPIQLLSIDFDGTLVSRVSEPVLDAQCMELICELQNAGVVWAINTGRSVDLLESGLTDFAFPIRPDFILTTERDVFRPGQNGDKWEPFGDWNERCARDTACPWSYAPPHEYLAARTTCVPCVTAGIVADVIGNATEKCLCCSSGSAAESAPRHRSSE